jgi:hypothetical protein
MRAKPFECPNNLERIGEIEMMKRGMLLFLIVTATLMSFSPPVSAGKPGGGTCQDGAIAVAYVKNTLGLTNVTVTSIKLDSCLPFDPNTTSEICTRAVILTGNLKRVPQTCDILNTTQQFWGANGMGSGCVVLGVAGSCTAN